MGRKKRSSGYGRWWEEPTAPAFTEPLDASWAPPEPRKVLDGSGGNPEVWLGPWAQRHKAPKVVAYVSLTGELPKPPVQVRGLEVPGAPEAPKAVAIAPEALEALPREFWEGLARGLSKEAVLYIGCLTGKDLAPVVLAILGALWGLTETPVAWVRGMGYDIAPERRRYIAQVTGYVEPEPKPEPKPNAPVQPKVYRVESVSYGNTPKGELDVMEHVLTSMLPPELRELRAKGVYEADRDPNGSVYVMGLVGLLSASRDAFMWGVELVEEATTFREKVAFFRDSILLRRFIAREAALVRLLNAIGRDPMAWMGGYGVGDVTISPEGKYVLGGRELTLEQVLEHLEGEREV